MRRTILMALLATLFLSPTAYAQGTRVEILRDCQDDGVLQGNYTASQMRDARSNIPAELDEYSDCRDVLTRAIAKDTAPSTNNSNGGGSPGTTGGGPTGGGSTGSGGGGSSSGSTGGGSTSQPASTPEPAPGTTDTGHEVPATPQEWAAIKQAGTDNARVVKDLKQVAPGANRLSADVGRNGLPGMLVAVLSLIAAAALALVAAPLIRRRGLGPRT